MIKMGFDAKAFHQQLGNLAKIKLAVMPSTYQEFVKNTPVKTGNARQKTTLVKNEIQANYAYAGVLDAGRGFRDGQMRGSKQAPQGMTIPATKILAQQVHNYIMKNSKGPR